MKYTMPMMFSWQIQTSVNHSHMVSCRFNTISDRFNFGKYKGLSLADVLDIDPEYVGWCAYNCTIIQFVIEEQAISEIRKAYPEVNLSEQFITKCHSNPFSSIVLPY